MPFPWPSCGAFLFLKTEQPIWDTDTGWRPSISTSRQKVLGGLADSLQFMAPGSNDRTFEIYMSPARVLQLQALLGTTFTFCDWGSPVPDARSAYLQTVAHVSNIAATNNLPGDPTNQTQRRERVRVELISQ